jgi:hypothetical protein
LRIENYVHVLEYCRDFIIVLNQRFPYTKYHLTTFYFTLFQLNNYGFSRGVLSTITFLVAAKQKTNQSNPIPGEEGTKSLKNCVIT